MIRVHATLRLALRWQLWEPRTRLRLIRMLMRLDHEQALRDEADAIGLEPTVLEVIT
jgi:hypothetical protein